MITDTRLVDAIPWHSHSWLKQACIAYVPGPRTSLVDGVAEELLHCFRQHGHTILSAPEGSTDVILTTAKFGEPLRWRDAQLFVARKRYHLDHTPTILTLIHATPNQLQEKLDYFESVLAKEPPDPQDYAFPGLAANAYRTLFEQGRRGGPILALVRLLQSQSMSIRIILIVGEERPIEAYTFDLVGAHRRSDASDPDSFYEDMMLRILTAISTQEVTSHQSSGDLIAEPVWKSLSTPSAMKNAGRELGSRQFFTEMVRIADLVNVPAVADAVSSQYSEGCFATWDPQINALIATVTGSARPVDKDKLADDDLSVIVGLRPDGRGAMVRHVEGKRNDPPSSEAVELIKMDSGLPRVTLNWLPQGGGSAEVPVARSKLHGHRGIKSYDPQVVEHVYLDAPYYHYPVSCSTEAQANAIFACFSRSEALSNPSDPRKVVFTVLPGHGIVIVEKWVQGKVPFQVMWELMDTGSLVVENPVPQGPLIFTQSNTGMMILQTI